MASTDEIKPAAAGDAAGTSAAAGAGGEESASWVGPPAGAPGGVMPRWEMPRPMTSMLNFWEQFFPLSVYNSMTRTKTRFVPMEGKRVLWYMCGPTVYDSAHMGHARAYLSFDIIRRIMADYFKYDVVLVMNITDIDDKIIEKAHAEGRDFREVGKQFEAEFLADMAALGVAPVDVMTRVTEYVPEVISFVESIMHRGFAYESNGSVYFDTASYAVSKHSYGKLVPENVGNVAAVAEGEGKLTGHASEKRNECDFALWKAKKHDYEPSWPSPWGEGRPGWHIECSAMAGDTLKDFEGGRIDIHSGGIDLRFPHHDNEIAQSEACFGCDQWVNYFLHAGHLHIDGQKMSKSLKNFVKIGKCLERFTARQVRMFFLMRKYNTPMNWSEDGMEEARAIDKSFAEFFAGIRAKLRSLPVDGPQRWDDKEKELAKMMLDTKKAVHEALSDDFDTPRVISLLRDLAKAWTAYIRIPGYTPRRLLVAAGAEYVTQMFKMFGLVDPLPTIGYPVESSAAAGAGGAAGGADLETVASPYLDALASFRASVRDAARKGDTKDVLSVCDKLRDEVLPEIGVRLEDTTAEDDPVWKLVDPAELKRELAEAAAAAEAKAKEKEENRLKLLKKKEEAAAAARIPPAEMFRNSTFSKWDEDGVPTHLADGAEVSKKQRKNMLKQFSTQKKKYEAAMKADAEGHK